MSDAVEHRTSTPWPCDFGIRTQSTYNPMLRRNVRARWRRCLGNCGGKWFWSTDALTHRMCARCSPPSGESGGEGVAAPQTEERAVEALRKPVQSPKRPPAKPPAVICAGKQFPSVEVAADALGMTAQMVKRRCVNGWRGWRYADQPAGPDRTAQPRPVIADGKPYPSIAAAARALGVSQAAVGDRIRRGCDGYRYAD